MTGTITLASRLAGAVWGHLVGDAVGVPYEFRPADEIGEVVFGARGSHRQPAGTWSDDGALMLALLDSLLDTLLDADAGRRPAFDPDDQGRRALAWQRTAPTRPTATGCSTSAGRRRPRCAALAAGVPAVDAGPADEGSCGNGSLMRILPLALVGRDLAPAQLIGNAHLASRVTHGHPRCQVACAVYCVAVVGLLRGQEPGAALAWAFAENERLYHEERDRGYEAHLAALEELRAWPDRGGRGFVLDSFWSAWDAFAGATDYADAIRRAVAYGHDTDTTAAIAGGLAGARWGWEAIPLAWRRGMRGRDIVTPLVDGLVATTGRQDLDAGARSAWTRWTSRGIPALAGSSGRAGITFLPGKKRDGYYRPALAGPRTSTWRGSARSAWMRCSCSSRTRSWTGSWSPSCPTSWRPTARSSSGSPSGTAAPQPIPSPTAPPSSTSSSGSAAASSSPSPAAAASTAPA